MPIMAHQRNIPLLLLPDASRELGKVFGVKCAGVIAFSLPVAEATTNEETNHEEHKTIRDKLDSFLSFVKSNMI